MQKVVYKIKNIEEYGKLMAYCIYNDINVWRTYWDERDKDKVCYKIDWEEKRCYYGGTDYYKDEGYTVVEPKFFLGGHCNIEINTDND